MVKTTQALVKALVKTMAIAAVLTAGFFTPAAAGDHDGSKPHKAEKSKSADTEVYFIEPKDGAVISGPVTVVFGLKGMGVAPAGTDKAKTGHHHLIIDAPLPDLKAGIPMDENYRHFGGGQTQVTLKLKPGKHTLQLLLGDMNHIPHAKPLYSKKITITVTGQ